MGKMSEIDQWLKDKSNWFKEHIAYIVAIAFVLVMAIAIYGQADKDIVRVREKENRINNIENRLTKQENYMHEVKADLDNLYKIVNLQPRK